MKKMNYALSNDYQKINGIKIDKYIERSKIMSLIDLSEPNEINIIVSDISVLGETLQEIANLLNIIHEKGIGFKSINDNVSSHEKKLFSLFMSHINRCNSIVFNEYQEREKHIRQGGQKRGKRETFEFPKDWSEIYTRMIHGNMTKTQMCEHYNVSRQSIYQWIRRYEKMLKEEYEKQLK